MISSLHFSHSLEISCNFNKVFTITNTFDSDELDVLFSDDDEYEDLLIPQSLSSSSTLIFECVAQNLTTTFENRTVTKINGEYTNLVTSDDIQALTIHLQNTPFLPLSIGDHFKNLKKLNVMKSNVQYLMTGDLKGLTKLEVLNLKNNPIKQLGHDFFNGMSNLKVINFAECHLKMIDAEAFEPLINLQDIDLKYNECIDEQYSKRNFESMKMVVKKSCQGTHIPYSMEEKCVEEVEEQKESSSVLLILSIIILSLITAILVYALIKIRKELQKGSWNEMTTNTEGL